MVSGRKDGGSALEREPYQTFLKKFNKLDGLTNESVHLKITSGEKEKKNCFAGFTDGFSLDYCYAKRFDLDFEFREFAAAERDGSPKFCVMHRISYRFTENEDLHNIMMDTIDDIQRRNGYFYLSALAKECEVNCFVNSKNMVTVTYTVFCGKTDAKEVCLQLISHDIAMFARSF